MPRRERGTRMQVSHRAKVRADSGVLLCGSHANTVIHAADCTANLQVFCRENSGKRCPVAVCFFPALCGESTGFYRKVRFWGNIQKAGVRNWWCYRSGLENRSIEDFQ